MRAKTSTLIGVIVFCTIMAGLYFVRATPADYDKRIGGQYQIKAFEVNKNEEGEARLSIGVVRGTSKPLKPLIEIIDPKQTPIYKGGGLVTDLTLGEYVVVMTFWDTRLQDSVRQMLSLVGSSAKESGQNDFLEHVRVTYPPDDAMMVIYLGCSAKPLVETQQKGDELIVTLRRN